MAEPNLIKVCLTNKGEDTETPWAADLGPAGADGSRKVKLVNVPFMHAKPTWGDTIIVKPARNDSPPTWDREGVPWKQISSKIVEDGGRWAMIVDYAPTTSGDEAFAALGRACDDAKIVCEGAWGPRDREPGRVYLAVQKELNAEQVMGILIGASLPMELIQIHPEPKKRQRAQTMVGISDEAGRPPARAKTEPPVSAAKSEKSAAQKPAKSETSTAMKSTANGASTETSKASKPVATSAASKPVSKSETSKASKPVSKSETSKASKPMSKSEPSTASKPAASKGATAASAKAAPAKPVAKSAPAVKATPAKAVPAKAAPAKAAPAKAVPAKAAPAKAAPAKAAPAKAPPAKPAPKASAKPATPAKKADSKKAPKKR